MPLVHVCLQRNLKSGSLGEGGRIQRVSQPTSPSWRRFAYPLIRETVCFVCVCVCQRMYVCVGQRAGSQV